MNKKFDLINFFLLNIIYSGNFYYCIYYNMVIYTTKPIRFKFNCHFIVFNKGFSSISQLPLSSLFDFILIPTILSFVEIFIVFVKDLKYFFWYTLWVCISIKLLLSSTIPNSKSSSPFLSIFPFFFLF